VAAFTDFPWCQSPNYVRYLDMKTVRATLAVARVLRVFLDDLTTPQYGYGLMEATGYDSGKVYQIIARLKTAGWLERLNDPEAVPASGGPPRITYKLREDAVAMARRLVTEAEEEVTSRTPAARRHRSVATGGAY
jgi:PadR family transcriptional regulator PadR